MRSLRHENYSVRVVRICDLTAFASPLVGACRFLSHQGEPCGPRVWGRSPCKRPERARWLSITVCRGAKRGAKLQQRVARKIRLRIDSSPCGTSPTTPRRRRTTRIPGTPSGLWLTERHGYHGSPSRWQRRTAPRRHRLSGGRHLPRDRPVAVASEDGDEHLFEAQLACMENCARGDANTALQVFSVHLKRLRLIVWQRNVPHLGQ